MTTQPNQASQFEPVITAAGRLLSQRIGAPVQLAEVVCLNEEERRNRLLRVTIANPPAGLPASLINKQVVVQEYNPDQTIRAFQEYPHDISLDFKHLEKYQKLPLCFTVVAQKEGESR